MRASSCIWTRLMASTPSSFSTCTLLSRAAAGRMRRNQSAQTSGLGLCGAPDFSSAQVELLPLPQ